MLRVKTVFQLGHEETFPAKETTNQIGPLLESVSWGQVHEARMDSMAETGSEESEGSLIPITRILNSVV